MAYSTTAVTRGELTKAVTATGTLNPVVNVTVGSQVSGRISKLNVDFNSMVKSNEVIAEIDPATYQAAVEQARRRPGQRARRTWNCSRWRPNRSSELFTNKLISGSDYDTAIANLHEAEATVKIKQASLNNALVNLNYCKILSPVDGVVILRAVELGQTVASSFSTPTIFQIANDLTKMQIDSSVAEADVGGIVEGQKRGFHGGRVSGPDVSRRGDAGAQFADDGQQRRHLRLRHRRDQRGLQIEARHDGERLHHRRPA